MCRDSFWKRFSSLVTSSRLSGWPHFTKVQLNVLWFGSRNQICFSKNKYLVLWWQVHVYLVDLISPKCSWMFFGLGQEIKSVSPRTNIYFWCKIKFFLFDIFKFCQVLFLDTTLFRNYFVKGFLSSLNCLCKIDSMVLLLLVKNWHVVYCSDTWLLGFYAIILACFLCAILLRTSM